MKTEWGSDKSELNLTLYTGVNGTVNINYPEGVDSYYPRLNQDCMNSLTANRKAQNLFI